MLKGSQVALPTPFKDGKIDEPALRELVELNVKGGTGGLLVLGSTGEAAGMSAEEHHLATRIVVDAVAHRIPVVAGCGTASTAQSVAYTAQAKEAGADAALVVAPYYSKPGPEGIFQHFKAISDAVDIPIIVYNNPGRCVIDLSVDLIVRIAKLRNVIGLKDSNPEIRRLIQLRMALGPSFLLVSGDEPTGLAYLAYGGNAIYNIAGMILPSAMAELHEAWYQGDAKRALSTHMRLMPLVNALYCDTNPIPMKYALSVMDKCRADVRLPLVELPEAKKAIVREALAIYGVVAKGKEPALR